MAKEAVTAIGAPKVIGPYSQAIKAGGFVFCSGQIPLDPETGRIVDGGIEAQTERVLSSLGEVLKAAGSSMDDVVKTTVYMADLSDFKAMNAVYARFFEKIPPARATVQVAKLPGGSLVEIDAVAVLGTAGKN